MRSKTGMARALNRNVERVLNPDRAMGSAEVKRDQDHLLDLRRSGFRQDAGGRVSSPPLEALLGHSVVPHLGHYFVEKDPVSSPIVAIKKTEL
jgi:hypothetical protein